MIAINDSIRPADLLPSLQRMWQLSAAKLLSMQASWLPERGTPVFTVAGKYTSQGWTEWTQGFQFGSAILQFDATGDESFLDAGRSGTIARMASHVTHVGVHDHGFNNVSTYGNLRRLMLEGRFPHDARELDFYELALKASGAVQAARWSRTIDGHGYIYSFNGPHSLFSDTIRSLRALALAHRLGHTLMAENDAAISLLDRLVQHARTTAKYNVYYGEGRDAYDVRGRVAHESIFNTNDGRYRCPSTQQGFSPFSTWTRGLAWIMCGYAEQLEFLATVPDDALEPLGGRRDDRIHDAESGGGDLRFLPAEHADRRRAVLGHGSAGAGAAGGLSAPAGGPFQRRRAGRQFGCGDRGPRAAAVRPISGSRRRQRGAAGGIGKRG